MTDENTPGEQVQNTSQQQVPNGYVEQARFNGLVQKVETLTLSERKAKDDLASKDFGNRTAQDATRRKGNREDHSGQ